jgi:hypothetical protein
MTVRFICPYCGWTTDVADRYLGRSGECASCGKPIDIPVDADESAQPKGKRTQARSAPTILVAVLLALVMIVAALFFGGMAYVALRPSGVRLLSRDAATTKCAANLGKIGAAISAYVADHGNFPPAYTTDERGLPLHSWRVLILPYLGYSALHEQLKLDEPWNSPHNARFLSQMPAEYHCPADSQAASDETSYFVVDGPGGFVFHADNETVPKEIIDGASQTVLVMEATGTGRVWMQPTDISLEGLAWAAHSGYRGIGSMHRDGRYFVLTADGKVSALDAGTTGDELQALATKAGGEAVYPALLPP